jgi:murein DD-endopeptidase MepM/ murein hydrolase activator NlpD
MSCVLEMLRARSWLRAAALALTAGSVAACSSDTSRFNHNPFASLGPSEATGSISQAPGAPVGRVESQPLAPQATQAPRSGAIRSAAVSAAGAGGTARPGAAPEGKPASAGNWTWEGGTPITVGPTDSVDAIARRYGVPASAIRQANNIAAAGTVYPGQRLVIPRYNQAATATAAAPAARPVAPAAAAGSAGSPGVHVVAAGDTLSRISRVYHKPVSEIAKANNIQATATLNVGDRLVIPGVQTAAAVKPPPAPAVGAQPAKPAPSTPPKAAEPVQSASVVTPAATDAGNADEATKLAEGTGALPKFRWPANGRVIAGFGPTTNGQQNDGINIALPENTPVKAAEDGVVAYAGNELKGYGNLVLVRHPNGYVTAYAHAKELLVKRGDQVKRGQVIARSGQTGNVNAPQLHFEIRKGASPLDPTRFLNGA